MNKVLVIVDVQKEFDKFIQHDLVDELHKYAKKFDEVYQIWDTHENNVAPTYKFPNQVDAVKKLFGKTHFSNNVKEFIKEIEDGSYEGRTFKLSDDKGYIIRVDNNHDWFYINSEVIELIKKLKNKNVILVGGADDECLEDVFIAFKTFGVNVKIDYKYVYNAKTSKNNSINEPLIKMNDSIIIKYEDYIKKIFKYNVL